MLRFFLYNLILYVLAPFAALYLLLAARHRALLRRFGPWDACSEGAPVWMHACSVGEVNVARGLIQSLRKYKPDIPIVLTVSTLSGFALAQSFLPGGRTMLAPFDLRCSVRAFLRRTRPRILMLIETEIWPNLVRETRRMGIEVILVNGVISARKFARYRRYSWLMPPVFPWLSFAGTQDAVYAGRFAALGTSQSRIEVTGDVKFDAVATEVDMAVKDKLRRENGFSRQDQLLIFGSTRSGDESLAAQCWAQLKDDFPQLRLIIAPRHVHRVADMLAPFQNEPILYRSEILAGNRNWHARVFALDTLGELPLFYAISTVAVIGGSFFPGVEGHNPLEPAALGTPTVFGPYMGSFPVAVSVLLEANGAFQIHKTEELAPLLRRLLADGSLRNRIGSLGRRAILKNRGAAQRNIACALRLIEPPE